ncbi:MAG: Phosphoenolpyruvate-protein phosphotransferase of PTS system [Candidatus Ozemobacter sibiricus]|uniref:Phosphoenolpyruvate-protein phosphotransferase n=1 Tax=Candidatus Ozemobacter sibiricus TaxID=2268124 RepID=A0A367ZW97_9BACT|nr:MAG: Phosphoenolpyruvate-protein phosphotransferase of PTS system [Candidatus Ozemobacter sibiricus]
MSGNELQGFSMLKGLAISPGYAIGKAFCIRHFQLDTVPSVSVAPQAIDHEIARFQNALQLSRAEILNLLELPHIKSSLEIANIFQAHLTLLDDPDLKKEVEKRIRDRRLNAEAVLSSVIKDYSEFFRKLPDPQFQGKAIDILDVGQRILRNCEGEAGLQPLADLQEGVIIIAESLTPSEIADFDPRHVRGIAIEEGTPTSHASILARSLSIPALIQVKHLVRSVNRGDLLLIDGINGTLEVNPAPSRVEEFKSHLQRYEASLQSMQADLTQPSVTRDGTPVILQANIGKLQDVDAVLANHADGIGLYRTEFAYLTRRRFPTEDELVETYAAVVKRMSPREVTFRTIDLGGEKLPHLGGEILEKNPELGWRAIRMALDRPDILRTQFRAMLRACPPNLPPPIKILLPMVSTLQEFRRSRDLLTETLAEIRAKGLGPSAPPPLGIMVEIPSTALMARAFAQEVDFFSIGSNDLVQYTLAVDRTNSRVAHLYQPTHPAVLRLLHEVAQAGREAGKPVTICGELAGDPRYTGMLLGLGLRQFSMTPSSLTRVKQAVRQWSCQAAERLAEQLLVCRTAEEVEDLLRQATPACEHA